MRWWVLLLIGSWQLAVAGDVGSVFTYQGSLLDAGNPVNGAHDFQVELWDQQTGGATSGPALVFDNVFVLNGIFTLELDFGDVPFDGNEWYLLIQVRPGDSTGAFTALLPRQRVGTTPYAIQAEYLSDLGAANGDVLTFNGADWVPASVASSPWSLGSDGVFYTAGDVSVGQTTSQGAKMLIRSGSGQAPLLAKVGTLTKMSLQANGGLSVGTNSAAPDNGLRIAGDLAQTAAARGAVKAGVTFACGNTISIIEDSFNLINSGGFTVSNVSGQFGRCGLGTPFAMNDLFVVTDSEHYANNDVTGVSCRKGTLGGVSEETVLTCQGYNPITDQMVNVIVTVLFY